MTDRDRGLFPKPGEIKLDCSCPDWATMCKHVASVLYGVGSRLEATTSDTSRVAHSAIASEIVLISLTIPSVAETPGETAELIATEMALPGDAATDGALADDSLAGIFGIDLDTGIDSDIKIGDAPPPAPKTQAKPRMGVVTDRDRGLFPKPGEIKLDCSCPGRQAPPVVKARDLPVSTASAERLPRKAASGAARGKTPSPTPTPRKRAAGREGSECPRHQGRRLTPRHPTHRKMGGPTAPAERSLRRPIRRRARRIGSDCVSLGSDPRAAQPARPPAERPPCLVPAVR